MSTHTEALRGLRAFGPEHFEHLEGLIAERDQLLLALENANRILAELTFSDWIKGDDIPTADFKRRAKNAHQHAYATMEKATAAA